jgi:hypothetical protein
MSVPTTPSASSTSVSLDPRRSGTSRTGAEDRNVPIVPRGVPKGTKPYFAMEGGGR